MEGVAQETQWILKDTPEGFSKEDAGSPYPSIMRLLLAQRGYAEAEEIEKFLHPKLRDLSDPFLMPDMQLAVDRIFRAIDGGEEIAVFGDYDVDGITSVTLLKKILECYGAKPRPFIPNRGAEGYGLSDAAVERCLSEGARPDLLITVDCGTASGPQIDRLMAEGIDVIVADHHEVGQASRPQACAVVNPKLGDDLGYLCAAGVVFKVAHALLKTRPVEGVDLKDFLDLVAVATIADIVPLIGENRLLVRHGLRRLSKTLNHGLRALMEVTGIGERVTCADVGFRIGPRINAAGRMDRPEDALAMLSTDSLKGACELAAQLDTYNVRRQKHELQIVSEAMEKLADFDPAEAPVIVLGSRDWHPGVVGIVASRLMRRFYKPAFVVAFDEDGMGKGSGRSIHGVSLVDAIGSCRDLLEAGGGHHMAAGISVHEDKLDSFRERFGAYVKENVSEDDLLPRLSIDVEVPFEQLSLEFLESYELLQPFGSDNPLPVFMSRGVWPTAAPRHLKNKHLKLFLRQEMHERDAIFFGGGETALPEPPWDMAFTIDRNVFRGRTSLQLTVRELRSSKPG
jgi:single-stranded-DNA-specific exonuclease